MGVLTKKEEIEAILAGVCAKHRIGLRLLVTDVRSSDVVVARWEAMTLIRAYTGWSYPHIGQTFGKNHSSVMYGIARYFGFRQVDSGKSMKGVGEAAEAGLQAFGEQLKLEARLLVGEAEARRVAKINANPQLARLMGYSHAA